MQQAIGDVCLPSRMWNSCINLVLLLWVTTRRLECKQAAVLAQVAFSVKLTPIFFFPQVETAGMSKVQRKAQLLQWFKRA